MSAIEWTDVTWNPVTGCTRASAGCDHCYAVLQSYRNGLMAEKRGDAKTAAKYNGLTVLNGKGERHFNGVVRTHDDVLQLPFKWKKPQRVFVNSMSDLFHKDVPFDFIDKVFAVMALTPQHTYQILTKRPERMAEYLNAEDRECAVQNIVDDAETWDNSPIPEELPAPLIQWPLPGVWLGTSCENQKAADERIPHLLRCPAAVRFLSCEPLLGAINLEIVGDGLGESGETCPPALPAISWCIVGGESGPKSRPCNIDWIRSIVQQCKAAGVACFVKQLGRHVHADSKGGQRTSWFPNNSKGGDMSEWPADLRVREFPKAGVARV